MAFGQNANEKHQAPGRYKQVTTCFQTSIFLWTLHLSFTTNPAFLPAMEWTLSVATLTVLFQSTPKLSKAWVRLLKMSSPEWRSRWSPVRLSLTGTNSSVTFRSWSRSGTNTAHKEMSQSFLLSSIAIEKLKANAFALFWSWFCKLSEKSQILSPTVSWEADIFTSLQLSEHTLFSSHISTRALPGLWGRFLFCFLCFHNHCSSLLTLSSHRLDKLAVLHAMVGLIMSLPGELFKSSHSLLTSQAKYTGFPFVSTKN